MTKEQIAKACRIAEGMGPETNYVCETIGRLLDEREALLEAVRTALAADGYQPLPRESHEALQAAIAKAEAE